MSHLLQLEPSFPQPKSVSQTSQPRVTDHVKSQPDPERNVARFRYVLACEMGRNGPQQATPLTKV